MKATDYDKELGKIFRDGRLKLLSYRYHSRYEIAQKLGWTNVRVWSIESADRPITAHEMVQLCRLYGLDVGEVIKQVWGEK